MLEPWLETASCAVCHPGAQKALAYSVHRNATCTQCHTEATAHAENAVDPMRPPTAPGPVRAAACAVCHPDRGFAPEAGRHPWSSQLDRVPEPPSPPPVQTGVPDAMPMGDGTLGGFELGAVARFGYRFVNVFGSRERYETDLNLDGGFRLTDLELDARGREGALFDRASVKLTDLEDPYMRLKGEVAKDDWGSLRARFQKDAFKYRARGDFHRVDLRAEEWGFDALGKVAKDTDVGLSFTRRRQDGFWLTNRIGNRNVTPQTTVAGVQSPRAHDFDLWEASLRTHAIGPDLRAAVEYREHDDVDRWFYERTSPINPIATESEDFTSQSTLRGPGARLELRDRGDALSWSLVGHVVDLDRRIRGDGQTRGFDIGEFVTDTTAFASGGARTWLLDGTASWQVSESWTLLGDLRWRDHREDLHIDQVDATNYPNLNNSSTTTLALDQRTTQRTLEGTVTAQVEPVEGLRLALGYGFVQERLRVPDLETGDQDFVRGTIRNDGVLLDGDWRPNERWVVSGRLREFGQNGVQLHELSDDEVRNVKGKVRYQRDAWWAEVFTDHRRKRNDVSSTELDAWTSGVSVGLQTEAATDLWASYAYTDLDSRTLTNFYFDPDPNPVPTFVGFDGRTHTLSAGLSVALTRRVHLDLSGAYTSTHGTFDVQVFDWRADLATRVCTSADLGLMVRQVDYSEASGQSAGLDDFGSYLTFLYFRTRFGTAK
ncbi:MAG: hypothetical protein R3F56_02880 [Planctomycetota bacterium]